MGTTMRLALAALTLLASVWAVACPICLGAGLPTTARQLAESPAAVLAEPTADTSRFRVVEVIKGGQPIGATIEGGYRRNRAAERARSTAAPLLLVRDDPLPTWVVLGAIDVSRAAWLRELAADKPPVSTNPEEWRARVALSLPHLDDAEPLAAEIAYGELAAAPYAALAAAKTRLDPSILRRSLSDPELASKAPLRLLLLGICGGEEDAAAFESRLDLARQTGDATSLATLLAADLELRGAERVAWVESAYLADGARAPQEIKAALLALSVHGHANRTIPRDRVIRAYRMFMKAHPDVAGYVASDFATWQYWDAAAEFAALLKSEVRQQYPSQVAIVAYLRQCPSAPRP